jgi:high-affinity nickel permease
MFGLDEWLASLSDGSTVLVVLGLAVLLGLRHATDPDHLAAVTTLVAGDRERAGRRAARLGASWGIGHAATLFLFGVPIVLFGSALPEGAQRTAETVVGLMIVALAVWLLVRWRRGVFGTRSAGGGTRTALGAFAIGLVHGVGGSAGVGVLVLASVDGRGLALASLGLLAAFTAVSMTALTTCFGVTLAAGPVRRSAGALAPALGATALAFGVWYALGAQHVVPYVF